MEQTDKRDRKQPWLSSGKLKLRSSWLDSILEKPRGKPQAYRWAALELRAKIYR